MNILIKLSRKKYMRQAALFFGAIMLIQIIAPVATYALTSGPSQPEVQSFEPVGTTDMVDMFTGDFVYNIPLLDVEGYPVNISYHSGGDMEQEASWVGLGWNINPGVIGRAVRGLPDDMNGETVEKTTSIKEEKNLRVGLGVGGEILGLGEPVGLTTGLDVNINVSNYRGMSADLALDAGVNARGWGSAGVNLCVSSQNGADIDYNASFNFSSSYIIGSDIALNGGMGYSHGYNTRSGVKDKTMSASVGVNMGGRNLTVTGRRITPIALRNYVPVITNASVMNTYRGRIKFGGEMFWTLGYATVNGMMSKLKHLSNGSRSGFGYLYMQNASESSILDFTRDKDGVFNETMNYLPAGNMTYDVYSVSGQGTGGSFRPFRNDYGSVYDPVVSSPAKDYSVELEGGLGNLFSIGGDISVTQTEMSSGFWEPYKNAFAKKINGSIYENVYFKQAGELTITNGSLDMSPMDGKQGASLPLRKPAAEARRDARGTLMYYFTAAEASLPGVATSAAIPSYTSTDGFASGPSAPIVQISRTTGNRKADQISEVVQVEKDGRRYVYSIPAMNNYQKEVTFATAGTPLSSGLVSYSDADASPSNTNGRDNFYTATKTPAHAHSYLLTSVLSTDYIDIKGDGPTDDDFGSYSKFNYTRKSDNYKWKAPYGVNIAQYSPAFKSDKYDDRASFVEGSREQWMLHSIESKNYLAEFYVSSRLDARGVDTVNDLSYKLDSIRLYNKNDRFTNGNNAVPIKTIIFSYNYELCKGTPNSFSPEKGKLTLKKIFIRYGNSDKGMLSPYVFEYNTAFNYNYNYAYKDRWGMYKPQEPNLTNADFPFVKQDDPNINSYASAWSLTGIRLPSGGNISIQYEADDYAYVQDKLAMEMFKLKGIGNSSSFIGGNQLYFNTTSPNRYFYFERKTAKELSSLTPKENYLGDNDLLYYNFDIRIVDNRYENIKGYAQVEEVGYCSDGIHGYIKTGAVQPEKSNASVSHPTYTALNFSRYYLPHIIFPGNNPDESNLENMLAGLKYAFGELVQIAKNPIERMVKESKAKDVKLFSSYMRLNSVGYKKKGGGQRVKEITFQDNWSSLAGGNTQSASYGKMYDYTVVDDKLGLVSSGVASYEPMIGGDENPFRMPDPYIAQKKSNFPPNDPVGLYQELPVGESLFPPPVVGYRKITISSIHKDEARSAQGQDIYEYYTAKDFPVEVKADPIQKAGHKPKFSFKEQYFKYEASQGYTLIFNDMHGKLKKTEHRVLKPGTSGYEVVSYNQYIYFQKGSKLDNNVPVVQYDQETQQIKRFTRTVGVEGDITIDSRQKKEHTKTHSLYVNLNVSLAGPWPIPIPFGYTWPYSMKNEFYSVVATKVFQQYGILKEVQSYNEGAVTTVRNEAFDPITGQALITSVNNEYKDLEYSVSYPAYWAYQSMGASYENIGYADTYDEVMIEDHTGILPPEATQHLKIGDELFITYTEGGATKTNNVWVTGYYALPGSGSGGGLNPFQCHDCMPYPEHVNDTLDLDVDSLILYYYKNCGPYPAASGPDLDYIFNPHNVLCNDLRLLIQPRYKNTFIDNGSITGVHIKVVRSGAKNQLNESIQNYVGMETPFDGEGFLKNDLSKLISIAAKEFSDTNYAVLPRYDSLSNPSGWDSLNVYVNGTRGIKRVHKEYAYMTSRNSSNTVRLAGLFDAPSFWKYANPEIECKDSTVICISNGRVYRFVAKIAPAVVAGFEHLVPDKISDKNWIVTRTVNKWSPWGFEIENIDAIGNHSAAQYGYINQLPVSIAQNASQYELLHEGFEDFRYLQLTGSLNRFFSSPFTGRFSLSSFSSSLYSWFGLTGTSGFELTTAFRHSGSYALSTGTTSQIVIPVNTADSLNGRMSLLPFTMKKGEQYIVSYWFRPKSATSLNTAYVPPAGHTLKSNIIEGWQQAETTVTIPTAGSSYTLPLPANAYVDDIRILPKDANMKAFIYHPVNQKLIASLDENNFATFFEYDQEGNLVRTKKETEKGIMTINESKSAHSRAQN